MEEGDVRWYVVELCLVQELQDLLFPLQWF